MSTDNTDRTGVVLMAYGTPRSPDEIEPYYTDIRRGRPPTPEALADLVARYDAIGGISPLAVLTEDQRDALQAALDEREPGRFHVTLGLKHADPKVEAGAAELAQAGFGSIVGLVLAPHYSSYSIGQYLQRARDGVEQAGDIDAGRRHRQLGDRAGVRRVPRRRPPVAPRGDDQHAGRRRRRTQRARGVHRPLTPDADHRRRRPVPRRAPRRPPRRSPAELRLAEGDDWMIGWQSAGRTPEPWIGPDILDVIDELGADPDGRRRDRERLRLRRRPPRGALRPRHRSTPPRRRRRPRSSTERPASTTTPT